MQTHPYNTFHIAHAACTLTGMEVRVRSAELQINDDAIAHDVFYLTNLKGAKLSDRRAREVSERVHVRCQLAIGLLR